MTRKLYTVGHSTRTSAQFVELLRSAAINHVVDVRAMPRSRTNPQFDAEPLAETLKASGIGYSHMQELAGLRSRDKRISDSLNGYWRNRSFHNYADYALSEDFRHGIDALMARAQQGPCAIMCAEAVWWRCHRRIIADHLMHRGAAVYHLMGKDRIQPARLTPGARTAASGDLVYPAAERMEE